MQNECWKKFEKTGQVSDYLNYVQWKSEKADKEGAIEHESGDSDRNGFVRNANW
ncbi:MAG: hypothetical protein II073_04610 [Lachnospiraceae bacterium]|nr:hypothetical protein [Lachnospiraceae bacterium]